MSGGRIVHGGRPVPTAQLTLLKLALIVPRSLQLSISRLRMLSGRGPALQEADRACAAPCWSAAAQRLRRRLSGRDGFLLVFCLAVCVFVLAFF